MSILLDSIQSNAFLSQLLQTSSTSTADSTSFSVSTEGTTDFAELLLKQLSSVTTSNDSSALQQQLGQTTQTQTQSTTTNATKELIQLMTATAQLAMIQTLASQTDSSSSSKEDEAVENTAQSNQVATQSAALNQTSLF
ncbi:MAG TPA: hypothetical protein VEZ91_07455 [Kurthia gibsonii]|nr:hypothetical protein [Kurthia gibsonii]